MSLPPNFGRAVDLSSLAKPAPQVPAQLPGLPVTPENLTEEFLKLSATKVVLIVFYSQRHPESLATLSLIDKLNADDQRVWQLARADIEEQPQLAQAFQTKALPYVVALVGEKPVPLFDNVYPEAQIRMVIDKVLAMAAEQGIGSAPVEKIEPEEEEAMAALEKGDFNSAEAAYRKLLSRKPNDNFGKLGLAQVLLLKRTASLVPAEVLAAGTANPDDVEIQLQCADIEVVHGSVEPAFERLLSLITKTKGEDRTRIKDRLLELFSLVDPADPRLIAARGRLASALF